MISVVIADDERHLINSLSRVITEHCEDVQLKSVFYNGDDLLDYLKCNYVDIVITDIRMPGTSGLDVAKYIYENKINSRVFITTGYKEFDYAKKAVDYHVNHFFVKPFPYKDVINKINEVKAEIEAESVLALNRDTSYLNNWRYLKSLLCNAYRATSQLDLNKLSSIFNGEVQFEEFKCFEITYSSESMDLPQQAASDFCEVLDNDKIICVVDTAPTNIVCLLLCREDIDVLRVIHEFVNGLKLHYDITVEYSYLSFTNISNWQVYCSNRMLIDNYFQDVNKNGLDFAIQHLDNIISAFSKDSIYHLYQYVITLADTDLFDSNISPQNITHETVLNTLSKIYELSRPMGSKSDNLIHLTMEYLDENYSNPNLSISEIADKLSVNANYLGQIIKKKTGDRFVDLLLKIRMKKAKQLLRSQDMPIKDVAVSVGYHQTTYFRQLFKQFYGITPTQYRLQTRDRSYQGADLK